MERIRISIHVLAVLSRSWDVYLLQIAFISIKLTRWAIGSQKQYSAILTGASRAQLYKNILEPLWSPLSHDRIVPLLGIHANSHSPPELEVPYYAEGNIIDHNRRYPNANKLLQVTQIAEGISYLHGEGVEHGNICPVRSFVQRIPLARRLTFV